jgi:predicted Na+-dependent transporter
MKQVLRAIGGGILIITWLSLNVLLALVLADHARAFEWMGSALFQSLTWPLEIFQPLFPAPPEALSPDTPTPTAVLATLVVDIIIYSLLAHAFSFWGRVLKQRGSR